MRPLPHRYRNGKNYIKGVAFSPRDLGYIQGIIDLYGDRFEGDMDVLYATEDRLTVVRVLNRPDQDDGLYVQVRPNVERIDFRLLACTLQRSRRHAIWLDYSIADLMQARILIPMHMEGEGYETTVGDWLCTVEAIMDLWDIHEGPE